VLAFPAERAIENFVAVAAAALPVVAHAAVVSTLRGYREHSIRVPSRKRLAA
jgi:hypothetical protein